MTGRKRRLANPITIISTVSLILLLAAGAVGGALVMALVLVVLFLFYPLLSFLWNAFYGVEDQADRVYFAPTEDGWRIAMHYHAPAVPRPGALPVIVSHGILTNKYCVDLDREHSIACFLKEQGFPVFVISLRGTGRSRHVKPGFRNFNFDDIVEKDVPAAIQTAMKLTGAPAINWIGHSMGAMILYGFLGRRLPGHECVRSFVSIAGPGRLDHVRKTLLGPLMKLPALNRALNLRFGSQAISPLVGYLITPVEDIFYSKKNLSRRTIHRFIKNSIEGIAPGVFRQLGDWVRTGVESTVDGRFDYQEGLGNIETPSLFIAGPKDKIAPPDSVAFAFERARSREKRLLLMNRENGRSSDYCHVGLVIGERAPLDVFPAVLDWLKLHGMHETAKRGRIKSWIDRHKFAPRAVRKGLPLHGRKPLRHVRAG